VPKWNKRAFVLRDYAEKYWYFSEINENKLTL
jgi:hypothetical protein